MTIGIISTIYDYLQNKEQDYKAALWFMAWVRYSLVTWLTFLGVRHIFNSVESRVLTMVLVISIYGLLEYGELIRKLWSNTSKK